MSETEEAATQRYLGAMHAVQTGVSMKMQYSGKDTEPKHLRVGVNSAMIETAALADLLCAKGVITRAELLSRFADVAEREAAAYEKWLSDHFGRPVTLR